MEASKILTTSFLDILFDGRNKAYGAYELRKAYPKRMILALLATAGIVIALSGFTLLGIDSSVQDEVALDIPDVVFEIKDKEEKVVPPPPAPQPRAAAMQVQTTQYTTFKIFADNMVKPDEQPPAIDEILTSAIGTVHQAGGEDMGIVAPPVEEKGTGLAIAPKVGQDKQDDGFVAIELAAEFPGGPGAWKRYLERNLQYPGQATDNNTEGVVRVQFVVDADGNISEVKALNDPGDGLAEEAERIIKKGPKWKPAEQNGRKVKCRQIQAITFRLE